MPVARDTETSKLHDDWKSLMRLQSLSLPVVLLSHVAGCSCR